MTAAVDLSFLAMLGATVAREIVAGRNWRNLLMVGAVGVLLLANALMHFEAAGWVETGAAGWRLGLATLLMLIAIIGGRIVPSFTRNWLVKRGAVDFRHPSTGLIARGSSPWALR